MEKTRTAMQYITWSTQSRERSRRCALTILLLAAMAPGTARSQGAVDLHVMARTGQAGLTTIYNSVSINRDGLVAFVADVGGGPAAMVSDGSGDPRIVVGSVAGNMSRNVQINSNGLVITMRGPRILKEGNSSSSSTYVQLWNAVNPQSGQILLAKGYSLVNQFGIWSKTGPFSSLGPGVALNNNDKAVFVADTGLGISNNFVLATPWIGGNFNTYPVGSGAAAPMIADDGSIVVRPGRTDDNPILLLN